ncbi:MAG: hypothetical protein IMW98_04740 [Firmicutes bacterium]|nr:hypothetical protein [Bacillota bacterium]
MVRNNLNSQVIPGPCPPEGCPEPTEIVCIETVKVYDFCFQTDTRNNLSFPIPSSCCHGAATADCFVRDIHCTEISRTPIDGGLANVTIRVTVTLHFIVFNASGANICEFDATFVFTKTVTLCAPEGTVIDCRVAASACDSFVAGPNVHVNITLCLLIESTAHVKLLVPSFGFCVPSECVTLPSPPVECPPDNLFPPQCLPPT